MATPDLNYVNRIQNRVRWGPPGTQFDEFLDDYLAGGLEFLCAPGAGETLRTASMTAGFTPSTLAGFTAVGATPTGGTPTNDTQDWTLFRITSLTAVDIILQRANQQPNSVVHDDERFRRMATLRVMAENLAVGDGVTEWLGFDAAGFPRTDIAGNPAVTPAAVLGTLKLIDDEVTTHELGRRASCFITTARGRRNIEAAMEQSGFPVQYGLAPGVPMPVPFFRGRPVLVSAGLATLGAREPVFANDRTQSGFYCTSGTPDSLGLDTAPMPFQDTGSVGQMLYVHGALIALTDHAFVKSDITNSLTE